METITHSNNLTARETLVAKYETLRARLFNATFKDESGREQRIFPDHATWRKFVEALQRGDDDPVGKFLPPAVGGQMESLIRQTVQIDEVSGYQEQLKFTPEVVQRIQAMATAELSALESSLDAPTLEKLRQLVQDGIKLLTNMRLPQDPAKWRMLLPLLTAVAATGCTRMEGAVQLVGGLVGVGYLLPALIIETVAWKKLKIDKLEKTRKGEELTGWQDVYMNDIWSGGGFAILVLLQLVFLPSGTYTTAMLYSIARAGVFLKRKAEKTKLGREVIDAAGDTTRRYVVEPVVRHTRGKVRETMIGITVEIEQQILALPAAVPNLRTPDPNGQFPQPDLHGIIDTSTGRLLPEFQELYDKITPGGTIDDFVEAVWFLAERLCGETPTAGGNIPNPVPGEAPLPWQAGIAWLKVQAGLMLPPHTTSPEEVTRDRRLLYAVSEGPISTDMKDADVLDASGRPKQEFAEVLAQNNKGNYLDIALALLRKEHGDKPLTLSDLTPEKIGRAKLRAIIVLDRSITADLPRLLTDAQKLREEQGKFEGYSRYKESFESIATFIPDLGQTDDAGDFAEPDFYNVINTSTGVLLPRYQTIYDRLVAGGKTPDRIEVTYRILESWCRGSHPHIGDSIPHPTRDGEYLSWEEAVALAEMYADTLFPHGTKTPQEIQQARRLRRAFVEVPIPVDTVDLGLWDNQGRLKPEYNEIAEQYKERDYLDMAIAIARKDNKGKPLQPDQLDQQLVGAAKLKAIVIANKAAAQDLSGNLEQAQEKREAHKKVKRLEAIQREEIAGISSDALGAVGDKLKGVGTVLAEQSTGDVSATERMRVIRANMRNRRQLPEVTRSFTDGVRLSELADALSEVNSTSVDPRDILVQDPDRTGKLREDILPVVRRMAAGADRTEGVDALLTHWNGSNSYEVGKQVGGQDFDHQITMADAYVSELSPIVNQLVEEQWLSIETLLDGTARSASRPKLVLKKEYAPIIEALVDGAGHEEVVHRVLLTLHNGEYALETPIMQKLVVPLHTEGSRRSTRAIMVPIPGDVKVVLADEIARRLEEYYQQQKAKTQARSRRHS